MLWTKPEIKEYIASRNIYLPLERLYESEGINEEDVKEKSKYLVEKVLNHTMTDEDLLRRITHKEGRSKGLIFLEGLVESSHEKIIDETKNMIDVNLIFVL